MTVRDKQSCVFNSLFWVVCHTFGAPEFDSEVSRSIALSYYDSLRGMTYKTDL